MKKIYGFFCFFLFLSCQKDSINKVEENNIVPPEIAQLKEYMENNLKSRGSKKVEIKWNTSKSISGSVYANFTIDGKYVVLNNKKYSKNNRSFFFADNDKKPKFTYLVFISPSQNYKMDYNKLDLYSLNKIDFSGYLHFYDLSMNLIATKLYVNGNLEKIHKPKKSKDTNDKDRNLEARCYNDDCWWYWCSVVWDYTSSEYLLNTAQCVPLYYDTTQEGCTCDGDGDGGTGDDGTVDCNDPINADRDECAGCKKGNVEAEEVTVRNSFFYNFAMSYDYKYDFGKNPSLTFSNYYPVLNSPVGAAIEVTNEYVRKTNLDCSVLGKCNICNLFYTAGGNVTVKIVGLGDILTEHKSIDCEKPYTLFQ
jgi:hypothetical protein